MLQNTSDSYKTNGSVLGGGDSPSFFKGASTLDKNYRMVVAVDAGGIEDRGTRNRGIGKFLIYQFKALLKHKLDWQFVFCGIESAPGKEILEYYGDLPNFKYIFWDKLPDINANLLYLPNPLSLTMPHIMDIAKMLKLPLVCTFHDLIPLIFHQMYLDHSEFYKNFYIKQIDRLSQECDLFLCNSQYTAQDLSVRVGIPSVKLGVISAGVTDKFSVRPSDGTIDSVMWKFGLEKKRFFLFTGVPDQRKNSQGMFAGLEIARQALKQDLKLVFVGDIPQFLIDGLRKIHRAVGLPDELVQFTGYLQDSELTVFYHSALALLFPSLYEGFGLPIVEAMTAGLPVIAGNNSSQPEAAGDAAILLDVYNIEQIAKAIVDVCSKPDLKEELSRKGKIQSKKFTWERTAELTAEYLGKYRR